MKTQRSLTFLAVASALMVLAVCAKPHYEDPQRDPAADELGTCNAYFTQANACIKLIWEKRPTENEMGSFVAEFSNRDDHDQFIDLKEELEVLLWMPDMGHGSSPVTVEKLAPGQYRVSKVFFVMRGNWEIQFKLKNGSTTLEQAAIPYRF